jgi:hypothetical protein
VLTYRESGGIDWSALVTAALIVVIGGSAAMLFLVH